MENEKNTEDIMGKALKLDELIAYQEGSIVSRQIIKKDTGNLTLFAFDAGQEVSEHTAPFDAMVQIIDGEAIVNLAGETHTLKVGEGIIMPADSVHSLKAEKQFKMLLSMIRS
jgi:quercetin dioxygenase-like cupin family protein